MKIICVYRAKEFSPNMEDKDAAILNAVAANLSAIGHKVIFKNEEKLTDILKDIDVVFSMGRLASTLQILLQMENNGVKVINSSRGIYNCGRSRLTQFLIDYKIPIPVSKIVSSTEPIEFLEFPFWMKKGEGYSQEPDDVSFITNLHEAQEKTAWMVSRNVKSLVLSSHVEGDLIKFYGVRDTEFFYWCYASESYSKFGLEKINGNQRGFHVDETLLRSICNSVADIIEIDVYGGDCIVNAYGEIRIIDFNDWPSFSKCRDEAAGAIIELLKKRSV